MNAVLQPAPIEFVKAIRARSRHLGITTADTFLREFEECLDGACPSNTLKGVTELSWKRMMKRASRTLVYDGEGLDLGETIRFKEGSLPTGIELPPKTIGWTNVIVTTPTRDRDGDILETIGADLDLKAAHLFNHLSSEVVGRVIKQTAHTKKLLSALLSIMATEFAENVATMYEHGSLRTSHGFLPTKWELLDDGEGYHILEFKILEVSGVSVPSNPDAGPTEFSRNKLTHPLLKEWGRLKFRKRRKMAAAGIDLSKLPPGTVIMTPGEIKPSTDKTCTCSTHKNAEQIMPTKGAVPFKKTPAAPQDEAWDADAAVKGLRAWAGVDEDEPTDAAWSKYEQGFAYVDGDGGKLTAYSYPHHEVKDGKLVVNFKALAAGVASLNGGRGGSKMSDADRKAVFAHLKKHYEAFPDADAPELKSLETETKGLYLDLDGSWDRIRDQLAGSVKSYLITAGCAGPADWVYIAAMFPDRGLVAVMEDALATNGDCGDLWDDANATYYEIAWSDIEGKPTWSGEPIEREVSVSVSTATERAFANMSEKSEPTPEKGIVKAEHVEQLTKAMDQLQGAADHDDATGKITKLAKSAHGTVKSVRDAHDKGLFTEANKKSLQKAMGYCSEGAEHDDATAPIAKHFKSAGRCIKSVMDDAGDADEASATPEEKSAPEAPAGEVPAGEPKPTKGGRTFSATNTRKLKAASFHFKAIEHHDDADGETSGMAQKAYQPLEDMLNQLDSDPADDDYQSGEGGEPDGEKAGRAVSKENAGKIGQAIDAGDALANATKGHIKSMAKHAVAHLKSIVKPADPAGEAGENGADGTEGENGNPPKSFNEQPFHERCASMLDEAIDLLSEDSGDALIELAATGSRAGRVIVRKQSRQAAAPAK